MKTHNRGIRWKGIPLAMLCLIMAAGLQAQDSDQPTTPTDQLIQWQSQASFGMMGLTLNQTARLNVAWVSAGCPLNPRLLASIALPQVPVQLVFVDRQGVPLARQTVQLTPGQSASLNLNGSAIPAGQFRGPRTSLRALALLPPVPFALQQRICLAAAQTDAPAPTNPLPPSEPPGTDSSNSVVPVIRPSRYPFPIGSPDSTFKLTVEILDSATGETKLILENPSFVNGISPWPLAIAPPAGSTGGDSGSTLPAP